MAPDGTYFDVVVVRELARRGAWLFGIAPLPGFTLMVWLYSGIRSWHGAAVGALRLVLVAAFYLALGFAFGVPFRRGMSTVGELPQPAQVRQGRRNVPPIWYWAAGVGFFGGGGWLVYWARHHGAGHHVAILSLGDLHAAFTYTVLLFPAFLCLVLVRTGRAVRAREDNEDVTLMGEFEPVFGLGRDKLGRTYLWPVAPS